LALSPLTAKGRNSQRQDNKRRERPTGEMSLTSWSFVAALVGILLLVSPGLAASSSAAVTVTPFDFCFTGAGAICGISNDLQDTCAEVETEDYLKCICESGYVDSILPHVSPHSASIRDAQSQLLTPRHRCDKCRERTGDGIIAEDYAERQSSSCKQSGYTIAAIPSKYSSDIKQRTKTEVLPKITSTYSKPKEATSVLVSARTSTLHGVDPATITLPALVPPTGAAVGASPGEGAAAAGLGSGSRRLAEMILVVCGVTVVLVAF
jgi:hypothetical protein